MVADRIRFHLDENMDPDIALALRRCGVDVTTTLDAGLRTANDESQLAYACREHRVLVTGDCDFLRFAANNQDHPGIVFCDRLRRPIGEIVRALILVYEVLTPQEISGRVEFV